MGISMVFDDFGRLKTKPNKANRRPLAGNPKHEALNTKELYLTEPYLKKQSQFVAGLNCRKALCERRL